MDPVYPLQHGWADHEVVWDKWKRTQKREHNLVIDLWDETQLTVRLRAPEADQVRRAYYELPTAVPPADGEARPVLEVDEDKAVAFDSALFVRQMREAGHLELDGARRQFFNADLVAREIAHNYLFLSRGSE
ncbi:hypothetical protein [Streptomyces chartreusis]